MSSCLDEFEKAIQLTSGNDVDAIMGKAKFLELIQQYEEALDVLNSVIVNHTWFTPAFTTKANVLVKLGDWEQAVDMCQQSNVKHDLEAKRLVILYNLVQNCDFSFTSQLILDLFSMLERAEPKNAAMYIDFSSPWVRLSGRNIEILNSTMPYCEKAMQLEPNNSMFVTEYGLHQVLMNDPEAAMESYKNGFKIDQLNMRALHGIIHCQILMGNLDDAKQQLEFLSDIDITGKAAVASYLNAILLKRSKSGSAKRCLHFLGEALQLHVKGLKTMPRDHFYYFKFDPDFLLLIAKEYLEFCGSEPADPSDPPSAVLKKATTLLKLIVKHVPACIEAQFLLAKAFYLANDMDEADSKIQVCFRLMESYSDAHLLRTQILLHQKQFSAASQSLEMALSHNFEVRESPLYHLITAKVNEKVGNSEESLRVLEAAMKLPGVKDPGSSKALNAKYGQIPIFERCSLYLELANVYASAGRHHEAAKALQDALNEFQGTSEHVRVLIANAKFAVSRGAMESALETLGSITHKMPYYMKAKTEMAKIYLNHRKNKKQYVKCYQEMVEANPTMHTWILLGDANMNIQQPEEAVEAYQAALELNPNDAGLATRIGKALVSTHDYGKAIEYYEAAVQADPHKFVLRYDLAVLYKRLKQYSKSTYVLNAALKDETKDPQDVNTYIWDVKFLKLLAQVHEGEKLLDAAIEDLTAAKSTQQTVLSMIKGEQREMIQEQKEILSDICFDVAEYHRQKKSFDNAFTFYNEALRNNQANNQAMMALATMHLSRGELDQCREHCVHLLRMDPSNEEAHIMMADLMFKSNKINEATHHFEELLKTKPDHYKALVRLIDLLRRAGNLPAVEKYLDMAKASSPKAKYEAGYHFARGIYLMHSKNLQDALVELNAARRDPEWGEEAIYVMIKVFLNVDVLAHDAFESAGGGSGSSSGGEKQKWSSNSGSQGDDSLEIGSADAIKSAQRLLQELPRKDEVMKYRVLPAYVLMRNGTKSNYEKALELLINLSNEDDGLVVPLAMATAYIGLGSGQKAKNLLRAVNNQQTYTHEDAEEWERLWLLLADNYVQAGKYDVASGFLKKVLEINKSSAKSLEYSGFIMEKEGAYASAAEAYEKAWEFANSQDPALGYRLAFNLLKAKDYIPAIDVCHKVLESYPRYPKIREQVLEKARGQIRVKNGQ
eukprot:TRINITY_DN3441_c0_g2_i6.p1 TRINITY_DN3441_c0_g2~~TRINITY_DN3441_c0_g2_i6.p1  ORF type:complete len:1340 (-),score=495.80 TRINITY_DN3441_c0_g2_i6:48-3578(-)